MKKNQAGTSKKSPPQKKTKTKQKTHKKEKPSEIFNFEKIMTIWCQNLN